MSNRSGGDRTKPETVAKNQVWCREGKSGTHFVITAVWINRNTVLGTYTVEDRRQNNMKLNHLLSNKNGHKVVEYLSTCHRCIEAPKIRYGRTNGERIYHVACDCLEFDGQSPDLITAIRIWKANLKYLGPPMSRYRSGNEGVVRKAKSRD